MQTDDLLTLFRSEMKDQEEPYLWEDREVYSYLADAQSMFCRLTDGIADATTAAVVDIEVEEGDEWLDLHSSILKIRGATRTSDGRELAVLNYEDLAPRGIRFDGTTGELEVLVVGMEENKLRLCRVADGDDAIKLLVFRLPLLELNESNQDLEIGTQHHLHLLLWAKSLAYLKQDAETFNKSKSEELEMKFRAYCAKAQEEQGAKRHKVRTVAYGGI